MAGRFLAAPALLVALLIGRLDLSPRLWVLMGVIFVTLGFSSPYTTVFSGDNYGSDRDQIIGPWGIADERAYYYQGTGLLQALSGAERPHQREVELALEARESGDALQLVDAVGMVGYYVGRNVHLVDRIGLGDALLSRLPAEPVPSWRPGHPQRRIPAGYLETLEVGTNQIEDENLRRYYDRLTLVIRGDLGSLERLKTILFFNLGVYDRYISEFETAQYLQVTLLDFDNPNAAGLPTDPLGRIEMPGTGIEIDLGVLRHAREMRLGIEGFADFGFVFLRGEQEVGRAGLRLAGTDRDMHDASIAIPQLAFTLGYDRVRIRPIMTDNRFSVLKPLFVE